MNLNWVWIAVAIAIVLLARQLSKALGNLLGVEANEQQTQAQQTMQQKNYFDPNLWSDHFAESAFNSTTYDQYAVQINDSFGYFVDDETVVYGVLQTLPTGCAVSYLSYRYFKKFGTSMLGDIDEYFWDSEMLNVANIVNRKPLK